MIKNLIDGTNFENEIAAILSELHETGPVNPLVLEKLSYFKKFHPITFKKHEKRVIYLMGLFYKTTPPRNVVEEVYSIFSDTIKEQTQYNFSPVQASAYLSIKKKKYFSFSAPTSSGKSYLFRSLIKESSGDIVIVVPSRALVAEYLHEVTEHTDKTVLVLQFIDNINTSKISRRVFIITPERGGELFKYSDQFNINLFLFDEAHLSESTDRGMIFDSFVRRVDKAFPNSKKVFAHPFVDNPEAQLQKHGFSFEALSKNYLQHTVGKLFIAKKRNQFEYFSPNMESDPYLISNDPVEERLQQGKTILIYVSKAKIYDDRFLTDFRKYIDLCPKIRNREALRMIEKLRLFIGADSGKSGRRSQMIELMGRGIVIHHGSIPLKCRLIIEEFVRSDFARICFATSTLGQGINMPFDVVWIDNFVRMDVLTLKNLIGRSGRTTQQTNSFDLGYTIIESKNLVTFVARFNELYEISNVSSLDSDLQQVNEDERDIVEALKGDSFNDFLHLPQSQIDRLSNSSLDTEIQYLLNSLLEDGKAVTGNKYTNLPDREKTKIKKSLKAIYIRHLRRPTLSIGEQSILSAAIPILLWRIQGRSFSEVVSLRYAYLTRKDDQQDIKNRQKNGELSKSEMSQQLNELVVRYSPIPSPLPDKRIVRVPPFSRTPIAQLQFDHVVYDTYDYLDKVISLSLIDPLCAAFTLYYERTRDLRALTFSNYIRYGTSDPNEMLLLRYGFSFEDIEWIVEHLESISEDRIVFKNSIQKLDNEKLTIIERFI